LPNNTITSDSALSGLDSRLKAVALDSSIATSGNQKGTRCFIDAMHAVLHVLCGDECISDARGGPFTQAVKRLSLANIDGLENLRDDLIIGEANAEFDWEPLEHVLALRPLFFRLLRSTTGPTRHGRQAIGPKASAGDPMEAAWHSWLSAAHLAVTALGQRELMRLWIYTDLCIRWRARMEQIAMEPVAKPTASKASSVADVPAKESTKIKKSDFPKLDHEASSPVQVGASQVPSSCSQPSTSWASKVSGLGTSQRHGTSPSASTLQSRAFIAPACGISLAGRPPLKGKVKASQSNRSALSGVSLNADKQPMLCKDEDLVLIRKPSEEYEFAPIPRNATKVSNKRDIDRIDQEEQEMAAAMAASLASASGGKSAPSTQKPKEAEAQRQKQERQKPRVDNKAAIAVSLANASGGNSAPPMQKPKEAEAHRQKQEKQKPREDNKARQEPTEDSMTVQEALDFAEAMDAFVAPARPPPPPIPCSQAQVVRCAPPVKALPGKAPVKAPAKAPGKAPPVKAPPSVQRGQARMNLADEAFPDLPQAAPPPMSAAAKAGKRAREDFLLAKYK